MRDKVYLFVDASNFARLQGSASLKHLLEARDSLVELIDGRPHQIVVIADSGLHKKFKDADRERFEQLVKRQEIVKAPQSVEADVPLIELAIKHDGHVVTGDGFWDHGRFWSWLHEPKAARVIGGTYDQIDGSWLFTERRLKKSSSDEKVPRSLSQVFDDLYPTPRSVFRQLGLTIEQLREFSNALELSISETDIISQEEAERIRVTVRQLLEYRTPISSLLLGSNVSERDCLKWLSLNGSLALQRDGSHFVAEDVAVEIQTWITSAFPTLLAFQLKRAIEHTDILEIRRLINDLDFDGDLEMVAFARVSLVALETESELDWSHFEILSPILIDHAMELLVARDKVSQLVEVPNQIIEKLPPRYRALIHSERFIRTRAYDELVSFLTITSQNISESETAVSKVGRIVLKDALNGSLVLPSKSWKVLGELFHASIHSTPVIDVCRYLAGQRFEAVAYPVGRVKSVRDELRNRYVIEVLGISWISASELGNFLEDIDLKTSLSEEDYSSFFSSSQVVEFIEGKIDELDGDETEGAQVAFSALVLKRIQPLLSVVQEAIDGVEAVRN
jgi:hypothetical protein